RVDVGNVIRHNVEPALVREQSRHARINCCTHGLCSLQALPVLMPRQSIRGTRVSLNGSNPVVCDWVSEAAAAAGFPTTTALSIFVNTFAFNSPVGTAVIIVRFGTLTTSATRSIRTNDSRPPF